MPRAYNAMQETQLVFHYSSAPVTFGAPADINMTIILYDLPSIRPVKVWAPNGNKAR